LIFWRYAIYCLYMNTKQALKQNNITAHVLTNWNSIRCKFHPGEKAVVSTERHLGKGKVIAVSTVDGKRIRSESRGWTHYFVQFKNGMVRGFDSSILSPA